MKKLYIFTAMNEQMPVIYLEPVKDTSLHNMCVRLGGCTFGKYTMLTGERTDHLVIEFLKDECLKKALFHGRN